MVDAIGDLLAAGDPVSCAGYLGEDNVHPEDIIGRERIEAALSRDRRSTVRAAASTPGTAQDGVLLTYSAGSESILELVGTVEMVFSQAVLEHVDDLEQIYASIASALAPGGFASHAIDFKSHSFARDWNGHWTFSDREWALVRGRRALRDQPTASRHAPPADRGLGARGGQRAADDEGVEHRAQRGRAPLSALVRRGPPYVQRGHPGRQALTNVTLGHWTSRTRR